MYLNFFAIFILVQLTLEPKESASIITLKKNDFRTIPQALADCYKSFKEF